MAIFRDLIHVDMEVYVDDILVKSKTRGSARNNRVSFICSTLASAQGAASRVSNHRDKCNLAIDLIINLI